MARNHTWHQSHQADYTVGQRIADGTARVLGSWPFIIGQTILVGVWITLNLIAWARHWDPYPFILLNLMFSTQAAYAAPVLMMSQNRQAERDRYQAQADYDTNRRSETDIQDVQLRLERIEVEKLDRILELLERTE
ncbi:MAG: DUF1003 domain-containing protein [Coriobacteriia bacterium]|nr:DUF1003 domain-containing protein [Coriobacteriia bacterium]